MKLQMKTSWLFFMAHGVVQAVSNQSKCLTHSHSSQLFHQPWLASDPSVAYVDQREDLARPTTRHPQNATAESDSEQWPK